MTDKDLSEFKADHSGGDVVDGAELADATTAAGGAIKKRLADVKKSVDPKADKVDETTPGQVKEEIEEVDITEAFASIFEVVDISEEVITKFEAIFEAAVHEAASEKAHAIVESLEADFEEQLAESVQASMDEMTENLDKYLDYVVTEWMSENEIAIESGIKVEMAESFMDGLKGLFYEHNIDLDESEIDVVAALEEELEASKTEANKAINESIRLGKQIDQLQAAASFALVAEGLTDTQTERLRTLSENLDVSDLDGYASNLTDLKEAFFKKKPMLVESAEMETADELITETVAPKVKSAHASIDAIVRALDARK